LIPETIRSGGRGISSQTASFTLSAGLPSTIQPRFEPSSASTCLITSGLSSVIECPTPLCSTAGAITVTSPSRISSLRRARSPGANTPSSLVSKIRTGPSPILPLASRHADGAAAPPPPKTQARRGLPEKRDRNGRRRPASTAAGPQGWGRWPERVNRHHVCSSGARPVSGLPNTRDLKE
jgi:hypothetical protein